MELRTGKISRTVLDRSVLKRIPGSVLSEDCVFWEEIALTADPITLSTSRIGELSVYAAIGDLSAAGAQPLTYSPVILLPPGTEESELRRIMDQIGETCARTGLKVTGGHTEVTSAAARPLVIGTACGRLRRKREDFQPGPGMPVFMTKWAGLEGTYLLAVEKEKELLSRFPSAMVIRTKGFRDYLGTAEESAAAAESGNCLMHDVSEGGIFAALWSLADLTGSGLDIDMKQIPLRQETIEYTDYFGINPYQMESAGSLLIIPEDPERLMKNLAAAGIPSGVIGTLTGEKARIRRSGDEIRYLDLPQPDPLIEILG